MKKILVIEDESQIVKIYSEKLTLEGYAIDSASTVDEAITKLAVGKYSLIIMDIMLPGGKNGFDFLEEVKRSEKYKNIPVIVLTNLDTEEKTARQIGADDYLVKANTPIETVITKIKEFLH